MSGEELLRRFFQGDEHAFELIVDMHKNELARFINGIISDTYEAEQLMIEAFARLAIWGARFDGRSSLKTYLFAIGKNLALRHLRIRGREKNVPISDIMGMVYCGETPEVTAERNEEKRMLYSALDGLKSDHRTVIVLLYINGMSYSEAGRVMKKSVRQIEGLARRAKSALKSILEKNRSI